MRVDTEGAMVVAGIDVGSSAVKVAILEDGGDAARLLVGRTERIRRRDPHRIAEEMFASCLSEAGRATDDLAYVASTGEGDAVPFRTGHFYGMTTHARGGLFLEPRARAIVDIGGLHARAVLMDERAKVLGYRMTSQCASGSGQYLGITMDEIGPLSLSSRAPEPCSSICAVLAETDVINMVSRGIAAADIIKGIHASMAGRTLRLLTSAGAGGEVLVTGGLAADVGLIAALREAAEAQAGPRAALTIRTHEHSVLAGAIGAALWGAFRARRLAREGTPLVAEA